MNVLRIVEQYLRANDYDGLFNEHAECACLVADLAPCGQIGGDCQPGYRAPCDCGDHDFHVRAKP